MPKRRDSGDGTFRELPNGTLEYTISYGYDAYGRRQRKRFYGKNPAECRRKSKDFLKGVGSKKNAVTDYTLGKWLDRWLASYRGKRIPAGERQIQQSTLDEYKKYAGMIKKHKIANVLLTNIKPIMISDFLADDLEKYSHTVIKKTRFLLNAAFEVAIENDFCYKNPMRTAAIPQKAPGEKKAFTDIESTVITEFACHDREFGASMLLLLHAGLRSEELRAIGPCDIVGRIVTIDKAVKEGGNLGLPKNGRPRVVPLPADIVESLHRCIDQSDKYLLGGDEFLTKDKLRSRYDAFFRRLNKHLESQKQKPIKRLPPHCCRHTYATQLRRKGVPLEIVSALLGHSELSVTDGYTHLNEVDDLIKALDSQPKNKDFV